MIKEKIDATFLYYFNNGRILDAYKYFGAHIVKDEEGKNIGCEFVLYCPNATNASVVGEWNNFNPKYDLMEKIDDSGVWYAYLKGDYENKRYKYYFETTSGAVKYKSDPYAFYSALRPSKDSKVYNLDTYTWNDDNWVKKHKKTYDQPLLVYEMHLGSWLRKDETENEFYTAKEIAYKLVEHLEKFGYTHVEVMPLYEHPFDGSWGYQGTGYYSISSRYGVPEDFMFFVDYLHQHGYGVIMDWVPGHICRDDNGLYLFDGTPLYDYPDPLIRENVEWGTANLDLGKGMTRSFLYSNAMFYLEKFHVDGFRVDAVGNLLYYMGNPNRGVNEGACEFLRQLSNIIFKHDDRVLFIAEDSTSFPNVTKPTDCGGIGFNYKWDMGWMNDTLKYFKLDPIYRKWHHHQLTFSMMYNYNEQFMMPLSHDEVVHMKGSILNKMPGDYWQQFANFRLLMGYMLTHPGKKLLFMGTELAPYSEWAYNKSLDWHLLKYPSHDSIFHFMQDLTKLYRDSKCLYELDFDPKGFKYIDADNCDQSLYIYARFAKNKDNHYLIVMNCTPNTYSNYKIGVPGDYNYKEVLNSDKDIYYGANNINPKTLKSVKEKWKNEDYTISLTIPPLGFTILKAQKKRKIKPVHEPLVK